MKLTDFRKSKAALAGVGLLIFGALALITLLQSAGGGEHPLALETELDLCESLGAGIWMELGYPAGNPVARVPENAEDGQAVCALELDPVEPGDRFARIARGDDADEIRRIATIRMITTGRLRASNPGANTGQYVENFGHELEADGWEGEPITGPWAWGTAYTLGEDEVATLVEDNGVVLWSTATGVAPDNLARFTRSATQRIRSTN